MRTTVTLDPDVDALLRRFMRRKGLSFKQAVNDAIRQGLADPPREPFRTPTFRMGRPAISLDKALQLAGELEDEELIRKLAVGK